MLKELYLSLHFTLLGFTDLSLGEVPFPQSEHAAQSCSSDDVGKRRQGHLLWQLVKRHHCGTPGGTAESVRAVTMLGQPHVPRRRGLSKCLFARDDEVLAHSDSVTLLTKQTLKPHFSQHRIVVVLSPKQDSSVEFVLTWKLTFKSLFSLIRIILKGRLLQ